MLAIAKEESKTFLYF